jgi:pectin-derived oligosaccharide transport system substrate-binding protein
MRQFYAGPARRAVLLAGAAAMILSACAVGQPSSSSNELSNDPVTLRFTWWGADARAKRTQQVIDLFHQKHQNITIKPEYKDWNGYWDSLATTTAANDAPDVIQMDELYLASYAQRGALLDLSTVGKHLNTNAFDAKAIATGKVDGKQYAVPVGLTVYSIVVNTDLLAKYNIPLPDDSKWSWDDLKTVGAQVSKASGGAVSGVQSWGFDAGGLNVWARQAGGSLYDDAGKVAIKPEVLASYWSYLVGLAKDGVAPAPQVTVERATASLEQSGTATNKSAFATWWNTQLTSLAAASKANLKLLKLPGETTAKTPGAFYKPSMYWSISSRSQHPAEAALFIDFLANSQEAADVLLTDRGVPANGTIRQAITAKLDASGQAAAKYLDEVKVADPPRVTPKGASNIEKILQRHTEDVLFGRMTPDAAATSFIAELQKEIDSA